MLDKPFTSPFDVSFIELPSVDSTNNYALAAAREEKANHGTAFFAWEQTAGKGQMGKKWDSERGTNIALSIVIDPNPLTLTQQFQLSASVAVASHEWLARYTGDEIKLKWPNDLYWKDRKIGGILIESIVRTDAGVSNEKSKAAWKWAIAGIGLNINQVRFSPNLPNPVSLRQITGKQFDPRELAKELHSAILNNFTKLLTTGFNETLSRYVAGLYKLNQTVRLKKDSRVFQTTLQAVSADGKLITSNNGIEEKFEFGEVSWII